MKYAENTGINLTKLNKKGQTRRPGYKICKKNLYLPKYIIFHKSKI